MNDVHKKLSFLTKATQTVALGKVLVIMCVYFEGRGGGGGSFDQANLLAAFNSAVLRA